MTNVCLLILIKNRFSREHRLNDSQLHGCSGLPPDVKHLSSNVTRKFDQLMSLGKVTAPLKLLSTYAKDILLLNYKIPCGQNCNGDTAWKSVRDILAENHPPACAAVNDSLLGSDNIDAPCYDPVLFEQLTGYLIRWAGVALCTHGTAGPSGVDAYAWRRLCSSFSSASVSLCSSLTAVAHHLCVDDVDSAELMVLLYVNLFLWTRSWVFILLVLVMFLKG